MGFIVIAVELTFGELLVDFPEFLGQGKFFQRGGLGCLDGEIGFAGVEQFGGFEYFLFVFGQVETHENLTLADLITLGDQGPLALLDIGGSVKVGDVLGPDQSFGGVDVLNGDQKHADKQPGSQEQHQVQGTSDPLDFLLEGGGGAEAGHVSSDA